MIKKFICILLAVLCLAFCISCESDDKKSENVKTNEKNNTGTGNTGNNGGVDGGPSVPSDADTSGDNVIISDGPCPRLLNQKEYTLYQNIFFNEQGSSYAGRNVTKKGTFAILHDRYNEKDRYYVWGYNDQTKCCDWQWEFVPKDVSSLPPIGSLIEVTGAFAANGSALDGYWIAGATVKVETECKAADVDVDMCTMGGTLERVEIVNMQNKQDYFNGKTVRLYGRVYSRNSIQHPYYDQTFEVKFDTTDDVPAPGEYVIISGTFKDGTVKDATVTPTNGF